MEPGGKEELGVGGSIFPNMKDSNLMLRGALGATFTSAGGGRGLRCGPQQIIVSRLFGSDLITFTFLCVVFSSMLFAVLANILQCLIRIRVN